MKIAFQRIVLLFSALLTAPLFAKPITTVIRLQERVSMEELAHNVSDPQSDRYQKFYQPEEIRQLSAPNDQEYASLLTNLKSAGFEVVHESPTHLMLTVKGEPQAYQAAFATGIQVLADGTHHALNSAKVPFYMSIVKSISGLNSSAPRHPKMVHALANDAGGLTPQQIHTAYGFDSIYAAGLTGAGQHIAIATYDDFMLPNVQSYFQQLSISPGPQVDKVAFNGTPTYSDGSAGETELDAEFSGMIAPGASIHVFASATNDDPGELAMFTAILDDNRAKVANYSWGGCETQVTPQHITDMTAVFQRAVAQGVNIVAASGDSGSDSCQTGRSGAATADWPGAAPYIVTVGGTSFIQDNKGVLAETGWNGSGGGVSAVWALPTWQASLGAPYTKRSYPDVSFNADPWTGQAAYTGPAGQASWQVIGGTSIAAPQWSGFLTLVGEARQKAGKAPLGYLSPILYGLSDNQRTNLFHDIVSGSNGAYSAKAGWDAVTGFGSMQAGNLLNLLETL